MMLSKNMFLRGEFRLILTRVTEADPPGAVRALGTLLLAAGLRVRGVRVTVPRQSEVQLVPGQHSERCGGTRLQCAVAPQIDP